MFLAWFIGKLNINLENKLHVKSELSVRTAQRFTAGGAGTQTRCAVNRLGFDVAQQYKK
jgi:hypothetical protein